MATKPRTCRAVEANIGVRNKYAKTLKNIELEFQYFVLKQILVALDERSMLAQDSVFDPKNPQDKEKLKQVKKKTLQNWLKSAPEQLKSRIDSIISVNLVDWLSLLTVATSKAATNFVKSIVVSTSNAQKKALIAARFNQGLIAEKWTVPIVKNQYVSPEAMNLVEEQIKQNVALITKISTDDVNRISDVITQGLINGNNESELREALRNTKGFNDGRIERVVLDQTNKLNTAVQTANALSLGVTEAIWKHVAGEHSSRPTHEEMDGKKFNITEGIYDRAVGYNVKCGELPYCFPSNAQINFCSGINKLFRHFYSGELTVITTNDGVLETTPNHPILTTRGWIPANELKVGDNLIKTSSETIFSSSCDSNNGIATIGQLFDSCLLSAGSSLKLNGSNGQFHGDGSINHEVDIIDINSLLADNFIADSAQRIVELIFARTKETRFGFFYQCFFDKDFLSIVRTLSSEMCRSNHLLSLLRSHLAEPYIVCLGASAAFYAVFGEFSSDNSSRYSILLGNSKTRHSTNVIGNSLLSKTIKTDVMGTQTNFMKFDSEISSTKVKTFSDTLKGSSFLDQSVSILKLSKREFSGHVYNLETLTGWYICNYITVHNCRCQMRLIFKREQTNE